MNARDMDFTDKHFQRIREFVTRRTGIVINDTKRDMVYGRLSRHVRKNHAGSFDKFCQIVEAQDPVEQEFLVNAITTNLTAFFRESHHFEYLRKHVLPQLLITNAHTRKIRIWSAGCSTGEEPYSIAMSIIMGIKDWQDWDIKILATDLDSNVVETGRRGVYTEDRIKALDGGLVKRFFYKGKGAQQGLVKVSSELQGLVRFKRLNLLHEWPMQGLMDIIFCRNVVIYFDKDTQRTLFNRYADIMANEGHLFIGHSESLYKVCDRFHNHGQTIYQKL